MKLLVVEPYATGHHMALHVRLIARAAHARGWHLQLLTTATATSHPSFQLVRDEVGPGLEVFLMPEVERVTSTTAVSLIRAQFNCYQSISRGFRQIPEEASADHTYMTNIDSCDKVMSVLGSPFGTAPYSGMMMSVKFHRHPMKIGPPSRSDWFYERSFRRLSRIRSLQAITVIDESFAEFAERGPHPYATVRLVPDPGELRGHESQAEAKTSLGISTDRALIVVYGSLTARKGIRELLDAVASGTLERAGVLLAGTPDEHTKQLLEGETARALIQRGQLFLQFGFLDDVQEYRVFRAADIVWTCYSKGFYASSGVLYQAGSLGLPVVGSNLGLIAWLINKHDNGVCCDPASAGSVVAALTQLVSDATLRTRLGANGKRLADSHTGEAFGNAICASVQ